jgi:hypothetical protein
LLCLLTLTLLPATCVQANDVQWRICRAALAIGQAEARVALFGRLTNGQIPADQEASIATNVSDAAQEIRAAMEGIEEPFRTEWLQSPTGVNNLLNSLDRFTVRTAGRNFHQRAADLHGSMGVLRSIFSMTFMSGRGDALRSEGNCDRFIIDACYNFGKASIAAYIDDDQASGYRGAALGSMRMAIGEGLGIAMDARGHLGFDGFRKKECCTFGAPAEWTAFQNFPPSSPGTVYSQKIGEIQTIVRGAVLLDPVCSATPRNPWDEAADQDRGNRGSRDGRARDLVGPLIVRGEDALSRCSFTDLQGILSQLAVLAPGDPRYQSLRNRSAQLIEREQEGLRLLREAASYSDLDRKVQLLKQAQQKFPCPKPELNQVISSVIRDAADQRRGANIDRGRSREAAWTSALTGIIRGVEQVSRTQSTGGTTASTRSSTTGGGSPPPPPPPPPREEVPPPCPGPETPVAYILQNPPPYGGGMAVCQGRGGTWIFAATVRRVTNIQFGTKARDSECWIGTKVVTPVHTYEGNLCKK